MLDPTVYNRKTRLTDLDQPAEQQAWDIALTSWSDGANFPAIQPYHLFALDGPYDWSSRSRNSNDSMRSPTHRGSGATAGADPPDGTAHARPGVFSLPVQPIKLYAVNKAVEFVPYINTQLNLTETSVTEQHWSVRKQKASGQE